MIDVKLDLNVDFDVDERNLISVCFRNYLGKTQTAIGIMKAIGKQEKYQKYKNILPDLENKQRQILKENCLVCAEIIRNKAYKLCTDNESMCFFQRLIGDYNRYAYEALDLNWYVEPEIVPEKVEEVSAA